MKKCILVLSAIFACSFAANAQIILGSAGADSIHLKTNNLKRMVVTPSGNISVNNAPQIDNNNAGGSATVAMNPLSSSKQTLKVTDNNALDLGYAQIGVGNWYNARGISVFSATNNTNWNEIDNCGIYSTGGNLGFHRKNIVRASNQTHVGYYCTNDASIGASYTNVSFVGYSSRAIQGNYVATSSYIDFNADEYPWSAAIDPGTRIGLKLDFSQIGTNDTWGIYQTKSSTKNYFNGPTLFGTATSNTIDKVQVTGGAKTDGFTANIIATGTYTATNADYTMLVNSSGATITLPGSGTIASGKIYCIKNISGGSISVTPSSGTIDGGGSKSIASTNGSIIVQWDGTNYYILAEK